LLRFSELLKALVSGSSVIYEEYSKPVDYMWVGIVTMAGPDDVGHIHTMTVQYSLIKRPV
jgi:hypothetical protein